MSETDIVQQARIDASNLGVTLWRNNVGKLQDKTGRWVSYGVCNPGGSDLLGFKSVIVTPDMVGQRVAIFTALEGKRPGMKATEEQAGFLSFVKKMGGISGIFTCSEDVKNILTGSLK